MGGDEHQTTLTGKPEMEARLNRLEDDCSEIRSDLKSLAVSVAKIEGGLGKTATKDDLLRVTGELAGIKGEIGEIKGELEGKPGIRLMLGLVALATFIGGGMLWIAHHIDVVVPVTPH